MSLLTSLIPLPYRVAGGLVLFALVVGGSYAYGRHDGDLKSKAVIAQFTAQKLHEDQELGEINLQTADRIVLQTVTQEKVIHDVQTKTETIIQHDVHDTTLLSDAWVRIHDASAAGIVPDATSATDATASDVTATEALAGVTDNYATCQANSEQLKQLQAFITDQQANIAKVNKAN